MVTTFVVILRRMPSGELKYHLDIYTAAAQARRVR